ncbi:hypothetical protein ACFL4N_01770 [Thermodesulfobacteriota bacterium]
MNFFTHLSNWIDQIEEKAFTTSNRIIFILLGTAITAFGIYALYFYIFVGYKKEGSVSPSAVVIGMGITTIGLEYLILGFYKIKAFLFIMISTISFWFGVFGTTFDIQKLIDGKNIGVNSILSHVVPYAVAALFAYLAYTRRRIEKI